MEFSAADFEKLVMFEHARKACEAHYNLLQWGGALLELAQFQPIPEAKLMLDDVDAAITRWRWWRRSRSFLKCYRR
ncbi:mitochondrial import receptor subunit TOM20-2 [Brassica napus]|uniref:mitochondrial import receptor subunit TOM20-2 n=1 Tax=Brassica napus TaxID=3708 RepID=UPI0006AB06DF|nr:mitochondrial import receptor subunit TOM20-2 [Brassica napus]